MGQEIIDILSGVLENRKIESIEGPGDEILE
jgi:hypothetical protein